MKRELTIISVLAAVVMPGLGVAGSATAAQHTRLENVEPSLQQAVHNALYRVDGRRAENFAQQLSVTFEETHPRFQQSATSFGLELTGYGSPVSFSASGNRVEYVRSGVREWYINDSRGIEQ